jgi:4-hydroxybenzoate polyprenyltransferase
MSATGSLFKRRDNALVIAQLLSAPVYWVWAPERTLWSLLIIAALSEVFLVAIYAFNRLVELPSGDRATRRHQGLLLASLLAFFPLAAALPNRLAQGAAAAILLVGIAYSVKVPIAGGVFQLKKVYVVKPLLVALGYTLQWLAFTGTVSSVMLALMAWQLFDVLVLTTLLDILDVKEDTVAGVKSFPVVHGFRRTLDISYVGNLLCLASGVVALVLTQSLPLVLLLLPRGLERHWRLKRLRKGKTAPGLNATLLRVLGTAGALLHWCWGMAWKT